MTEAGTGTEESCKPTTMCSLAGASAMPSTLSVLTDNPSARQASSAASIRSRPPSVSDGAHPGACTVTTPAELRRGVTMPGLSVATEGLVPAPAAPGGADCAWCGPEPRSPAHEASKGLHAQSLPRIDALEVDSQPLSAAAGLALAIGLSTPRTACATPSSMGAATAFSSEPASSSATAQLRRKSMESATSRELGPAHTSQKQHAASVSGGSQAQDATAGPVCEGDLPDSTSCGLDRSAALNQPTASLESSADAKDVVPLSGGRSSDATSAVASLASANTLARSAPLVSSTSSAGPSMSEKEEAEMRRTRALASLRKPLDVVTRQKTLIRYDEKTGKRYVRWRDVVARVLHISRGASADDYALLLQTEHWLEACDSKHRYGSNIKPYFRYWLNSDTDQSFFKWLDEGDGKDLDLECRPRARVEKDRVWYCGWERCLLEVKIENGKLRHRIGNRLITTDSSHMTTPCPFTWRSGITRDYIDARVSGEAQSGGTSTVPNESLKQLQGVIFPKASANSSPLQSKVSTPMRQSKHEASASIKSAAEDVPQLADHPQGPVASAGPSDTLPNGSHAAPVAKEAGAPQGTALQTDEALLQASAWPLSRGRGVSAANGVYASTGALDRIAGGHSPPPVPPCPRGSSATQRRTDPATYLSTDAAGFRAESPASARPSNPGAEAANSGSADSFARPSTPPIAVTSSPIDIKSKGRRRTVEDHSEGGGDMRSPHGGRDSAAHRRSSSDSQARSAGDVCASAPVGGTMNPSCARFGFQTPESDWQRWPRVVGVSSIPTRHGLHMPASCDGGEPACFLSESEDEDMNVGRSEPCLEQPGGMRVEDRSKSWADTSQPKPSGSAAMMQRGSSAVDDTSVEAFSHRRSTFDAPVQPGNLARQSSGSRGEGRFLPQGEVFDVHRDQVPQHVKDVMQKVPMALAMSKVKAARLTGTHDGPAALGIMTGAKGTPSRVSTRTASLTPSLPPKPVTPMRSISVSTPLDTAADAAAVVDGSAGVTSSEHRIDDLTDKVEETLYTTGQIVRVETQDQLKETLGLEQMPPLLREPSTRPLIAAPDHGPTSTAKPPQPGPADAPGPRPCSPSGRASNPCLPEVSSAAAPCKKAASADAHAADAAAPAPAADDDAPDNPVGSANPNATSAQPNAPESVAPQPKAEPAAAQASTSGEEPASQAADSAGKPAEASKLSDADKKPSRAAEPREKWIYVWDMHSRLYVNRKIPGKFHHSSFVAGGAVKAAGSIVVEKGVLKQITTWSGHYRPRSSDVALFLEWLKDKGVDMSSVEILLVKPHKQPPAVVDGDAPSQTLLTQGPEASETVRGANPAPASDLTSNVLPNPGPADTATASTQRTAAVAEPASGAEGPEGALRETGECMVASSAAAQLSPADNALGPDAADAADTAEHRSAGVPSA